MKGHCGTRQWGSNTGTNSGMSDAAVNEVIRQAVAAGPSSVKFNHGILESHPAQLVPPVCSMRMQWMNADGTFGDSTNGEDPPSFSGEVFADGSCTKDSCPELNRASWALVQVDSKGKDVQWLRGTVPQTQTLQGGEFVAALVASHVPAGSTTLLDKCVNVV